MTTNDSRIAAAAREWLGEQVGAKVDGKFYSEAECDWMNGAKNEGDRFIEAFIAGAEWARVGASESQVTPQQPHYGKIES
jgi:hypothetical protein